MYVVRLQDHGACFWECQVLKGFRDMGYVHFRVFPKIAGSLEDDLDTNQKGNCSESSP